MCSHFSSDLCESQDRVYSRSVGGSCPLCPPPLWLMLTAGSIATDILVNLHVRTWIH